MPEEYLYSRSEYEKLVEVRERGWPRTVDYMLTGFCKEQYSQFVKSICESIGIFEKLYTTRIKWDKGKVPLKASVNACAIRMIKRLKNENIEVFAVHMNKQKMICRHRKISSVYVNEINSLIKSRGYISGTIIESDSLEVLLNYFRKV